MLARGLHLLREKDAANWILRRDPAAVTDSGKRADIGIPIHDFNGHEFLENVSVAGLLGDTFSDLGVLALLSRGILPSDTNKDPQSVAVLSYTFWNRRFLCV